MSLLSKTIQFVVHHTVEAGWPATFSTETIAGAFSPFGLITIPCGVLERPHVHAGTCSTVFFAIASSDSQGPKGPKGNLFNKLGISQRIPCMTGAYPMYYWANNRYCINATHG